MKNNTDKETIEAVLASDAPVPRGYYSQGVKVGGLLFVSGQLPLNTAGDVVGNTMAEQARQVLTNIQHVVEAAGGTLKDLVQVTIYITDMSRWSEVDAPYRAVLADVQVPPARAVIGVKELHFKAQIEIQAIAFLHPDN